MLVEFARVAAVTCLALLVPGYLALRAVGLTRAWSLLCAPLASLSLIVIAAEVLSLANVAVSPLPFAAFLTAAPAVAYAVAGRRVSAVRLPRIEPLLPLAFLAVGVALGYNLFLSRLDSPDAIFQAYDVTQHLNLIQAMSDSGRLSSLGTSFYLSAADAAIDPTGLGGFYPSAWHALCALVVMLTGASVPLVINVSMFVIVCLAFPLAELAFLEAVFGSDRTVLLCGSVVALAFVAFPWNLLAFGPVYANVAGFSLMPVCLALFVALLSDPLGASERVRTGAVLAVCVVGMALCHPNTVFTCVIVLVPYCLSRIWSLGASHGWKAAPRIALCALFVAVCVAFWLICYHLPVFHDTVTHVWPAYSRLFQSIVNVLTLCYNFGFNYETGAQVALGALVVAGIVCALHARGRRWLVASYALVCYVLVVSATHNDEYKQLLAGFWYTDPMRLASVAALCAVPLAALGLAWAYRLAVRLVSAYNAPRGGGVNRFLTGGVLAAAFLLLNFMPGFNFPGLHYELTESEKLVAKDLEPRDWPKGVHTTFGDYRAAIEEVYSYTDPLSPEEQAFLDKVKALVPQGSLVVNDPMDGSFLAYGSDGLRVYYRNFLGFGGTNETDESRVIRQGLCDYATDPEVQAAVEKVDARYVLVLEDGEERCSFINLREDYDEGLFTGISSITPETPGFTLVTQQDGLFLYQIER